jgi:glutamate synthase (NADPH/NADH) small chain
MGKPRGFMEFTRAEVRDRAPEERARDFEEFHIGLSERERMNQGARCMDCGVPFCQSSYGCPIHNLIPEWNDLIYRGRWDEAYDRLRATNNFPEFTGRVCPAPCETACVLGINAPPVTIKQNECAIVDRAWESGLVRAAPPAVRTGKRVAVVGSGPAGLAAADQLNSAGHAVTVFERADRIGGLLMYGIPNMKLDKGLVSRRVEVMAEEGVEFRTGVWIGRDLDPAQLVSEYDAVLLACGATKPRDLQAPGREHSGVMFAVEFLTSVTKAFLAGTETPAFEELRGLVRGKRVVVIGGGDTGNDCIGTAVRLGAESVVNFELLPEPPAERTPEMPWPTYPRLRKTDYGHEEVITLYGSDPRRYSILTKEFVSRDGNSVSGVRTVDLAWEKDAQGRWAMRELPGTGREWEADLVLLALGFLGPEDEIVTALGLERDPRGAVKAAYGSYATSVPGVFAAGDMRRGQSLVVWAINEGRTAAREIDRYLMGGTSLP